MNDDERAAFNALSGQLTGDVRKLAVLDQYYEGTHRLEKIGLAVPPELEEFEVVINWPRVTADSLEERIDLEGFRLPDQPAADERLWEIWQANDLDEESQLAHLDALIFGRSFVCVGANAEDDETPLVTVESPLEMTCLRDPRTRVVTAALRLYSVEEPVTTLTGLAVTVRDAATLYLPEATIHLRKNAFGEWVDADRDDHRLGAVPVVPLVNRPRTKGRAGVSEMADAITITDAASRAITNAQMATELLAAPTRFLLGATEKDFVDSDGNPVTAWEAYLGRILSLENGDAKAGQFQAADLGNFTKISEHYAHLIAGLYGLPVRYFGVNSANPPSAEGIRADEARVVKRAERRERSFGGSWESVMRLVRRLIDGDWDPDLKMLETLWRDPATPTRAQAADSAVKLHQAGIMPLEGTWEDLGISATRREKLKQQMAAEATDPVLSLLQQPDPATPQTPAEEPPAATGDFLG